MTVFYYAGCDQGQITIFAGKIGKGKHGPARRGEAPTAFGTAGPGTHVFGKKQHALLS